MSNDTAPITLRTKDLMLGFNVAHMTLYHWRQGTATKDPLPHEVEGRAVIFNTKKVIAWAKKHGVPFTVPSKPSKPGRPGRKPSAAVKKPATALKQKTQPAKKPPSKKEAITAGQKKRVSKQLLSSLTAP